jgi:hypothetical protein
MRDKGEGVMAMPKNKFLLLAPPVIILILFNIFVFSLFGTEAPKFWPAYIFTTAAILIATGVIGYCVSKKNLTLRDTFLNWPLVYVSLGYATAQIILSFVILSADGFSQTAANLTQSALLAVYAIQAVSAVFGRNVVEEIDTKQKQETFFIKTVTSDLESLLARAKDPETKNKLQKLYDAARYSDPVSHESLSPLENNISGKVSALSQASGDEVTALYEEISLLLVDRNIKCKNLK